MWNKVEKYIIKHKLLEINKLYIVALSGGADSVSLLLLLHDHGYNVHAAHCNFHLRGEESDRDEQFCETLCQRLNVPFHRAHFDTTTYAEQHKVSIEMAARELRYGWFEQLRKDIGADGICVAHHRDDSVETVLLNLIRGTGLRGLTGIRPRNGFILRPLLCVSRDEVVEYLKEKGQDSVTDSTNMEADAQRNKVRLQLLPLMREINPSVVENISRTAENLMEAQSVLDSILDNIKRNKTLELRKLNKFNSRKYLIYEWAKQYGFNGSQVEQIMTAETGCLFSSQQGYDLLVDRERLLVEPSMKPLKKMVIPEEGIYVMEDGVKVSVKREPVRVSKVADCATLDMKGVKFPLTVRRVEKGDWMVPYGMNGRKLLSDLMTNKKMTLFEKRRQLVVVDAKDDVLWLVEQRTDNRYSVTSSTKEVLTISIVKG